MSSEMSVATKRNILGAIILTLSIVIIGVSTSYAFFVNGVQEINPENKGVSVSSGALAMDFQSSQFINANGATLKDGVVSGEDFTAFSVAHKTESKVPTAYYKIFLTDITMTQNFVSPYLKWALYKGATQVASGDFNSVTLSEGVAPDMILVDNVAINKGDTDNYKFYIWLQNDSAVQQNSLLEGRISAKVAFRAQTK